MEASIREREKVVQKMKEEEMRALDRERGQYKKEEAMQHFKALLSDLVSFLVRKVWTKLPTTKNPLKCCTQICILSWMAKFFET